MAFVALATAVFGLVPIVTLGSSFFANSTPHADASVVDGRDIGFAFSGDALGWSTAQIKHDFGDAQAIGATWVRVPFNWSTLEMQGKGKYNWAPADKIVYLANTYGLKIDAVVSYAPSWARPAGSSQNAPPTNVGDYGNFVAAAARRYGPLGVHTWEIWNEPNLFAMWAPKPNVAKYTQLLKSAYLNIKSVDRNSTVLTGGTSPAANSADGTHVLPLTFLQGIYANGGHGFFDGVAHHPSTFPRPSSTIADWSAFQQTKDLYAQMVAHGDGNKKIWATELAFPTGTDQVAVSDAAQGVLFAQSMQLWKDWSFTGPMFVFSLRDAGTNLADHYQNMGVEKINGTHKPGWSVVQQVLRAPGSVTASATASGATVRWSAPGYDYGRPITSYKVYAFPTGINVSVGGSARAANLALPAGKKYQFAVQPYQGSAAGVMSAATATAISPGAVTVSIGTGSAIEGNSGTRPLLVPVRLSGASTQVVTVRYQTLSLPPTWGASMPQDYLAASGTLTFNPGETQKNVSVTIVGDTVREPNDKFLVVLGSATNANIGGYGGAGQGIIIDDD